MNLSKNLTEELQRAEFLQKDIVGYYAPSNDYLADLLQLMLEKQEASLIRVLEYLPKVKERHGKPAWEHLGFGKSDKQPLFRQYSGKNYYGEVDANGKRQGRGI